MDAHEAIAQELRSGTDSVRDIGLKSVCFVPSTCSLSGERVCTFSINLSGDEVYAIDGYILLHRGGVIKIYRHDAEFNCKRVRTIESHLLLFMVRRRAVNQRCRFLFYNILLHLVKNGERKYDAKLTEIMRRMCIDWLVDVRICGNGFLCSYQNGDTRLYNGRLEICSDAGCAGEAADESKTVRIMRNKIEIVHSDRSFKDLLVIRGIRQSIALQNRLLLLTKDSIKVLVFKH